MNTAIIVGAGKGERMQAKINKILLTIEEKPLIYHAIKVFEDSNLIDNIILVINKDDNEEIKDLVKKYSFRKIKNIVFGGEKRQDSVYNGIKAIEKEDNEDIILIHNAANPFVDRTTIKELIEETKIHGAAVAAIKAKDTIKEVDENNFVIKTLDRKKLWQMQTPQAMKFSLAKKAFENAYNNNFYATDDVALVEKLGEKVKIVETNKENIKITTPEDLQLAEKLKTGARVGLGLDSHRFEEKPKPLILGGIEIPDEQGLKANSDGDVILHALFNALSQAIGEKSIGCYADKMCLEHGIKDSKEYLKVILKKLEEKNYKINNVGIMMEAKKPNMGPHHNNIKESLSNLLKIDQEQIGLTFTSGEDLTDFGKGLGIQCYAIASVSSDNQREESSKLN